MSTPEWRDSPLSALHLNRIVPMMCVFVTNTRAAKVFPVEAVTINETVFFDGTRLYIKKFIDALLNDK